MPYLECFLPSYPCTEDMWDRLSKEVRPIVVYGMGNGADKLIRRFEKYNIEISDFFASDGFVRGHSFHGKRVKSFSEIKAEYSDFVIVLSFASNRSEVIEMLADINENYEMLVPDMPVAGEDEYFDREFFNSHYGEIVSAYDALADSTSKNAFAAVISYRLTGKMDYLLGAYSDRDSMYSLLPCDTVRTAIDAGAYNGDTASEMIRYFPHLERIYALEPDPKNYKRLLKYANNVSEVEIVSINAAAWCESSEGSFSSSGNRNSSVSSTASFEFKSESVPLVTLDSIAEGKVDYVKYDVEGAEAEALSGASELIGRYSPALLISLYHRSRDIFSLVNRMREEYPNYSLYLRRLQSIPAWEINLLAVPLLK